MHHAISTTLEFQLDSVVPLIKIVLLSDSCLNGNVAINREV